MRTFRHIFLDRESNTVVTRFIEIDTATGNHIRFVGPVSVVPFAGKYTAADGGECSDNRSPGWASKLVAICAQCEHRTLTTDGCVPTPACALSPLRFRALLGSRKCPDDRWPVEDDG